MAHDIRYCFAWLDDSLAVGSSRAALWRTAKWPEHSAISISFLSGDESLRRRVQIAAEQWIAPGIANLAFHFRDDTNDTDIRIAFEQGDGSWSRLGASCRQAPKGKPTMNFGWLTPESSTQEIESVVLHEFGHALGMIHEHQHPAGGIDWNKEVIYAELGGPPNNWSKQTVDTNMFDPWSTSETNFTSVDPTSIMMYPIPAHWSRNGFHVELNTKLSQCDREFMAQQYP